MTDKILIDRSVIEQALEAFEAWDARGRLRVMNALRAALEQPQVEQEPYLWHDPVRDQFWNREDAQYMDMSGTIPLYTHPQPPRQPLTDEQIGEIVALKELNRELLVALKACDEAMSYMSEYDIPLHLPFRVKAAIAKATGGAA